jgi:hypothetical protein
VIRIKTRNISHQHDNGKRIVKPPLVLIHLLQEWIQKKALFTVGMFQLNLSFFERARYLATSKILKIIPPHDNGNSFNRTSIDINLFNRIPVIRNLEMRNTIFLLAKHTQ